MRSLWLQPDYLLTIPWMALSIDSCTSVLPCMRCWLKGSDFCPGGLPATVHTSFHPDILFGSFLPSLWS